MNVTVENLAPCKKLLRVEVEATKVDEAFASVTKDFQKQASLPGFRPGKAPRDMVAKRFEEQIRSEVKEKLTREGYSAALKEKNINAVGYPDIEEIEFGQGQAYQFAATVETAPEFEIPEYKGLAAKKEKGQVTDADVERAINMLRDRQAKYDVVTREVRENDIAVVNYNGTCEGKPITDLAPTARGITSKQNFWVEINKTSFIPGFADQLVGAKAGDKRTVNVDFPSDFVTPQLQGKKGTYEVEVVEVREKILPELNDELAKSYGAESLDKLRAGVRTDLENELKHKQDRELRDQVVKGLLDKVQTELPESVVLQETRTLVYDVVSENQRRGVPSEVLEAQKEQIFASANLTAKDRVKASFLFRKIAEKEKINVSQDEAVQRVAALAHHYQMPTDKFIKELRKREGGINEIYDQLLNEKVVGFLVENAKIEEVEPAQKPA